VIWQAFLIPFQRVRRRTTIASRELNTRTTLQGLQWEGRAHLPGVALDHINAIEELALELAALISKEQSLLLKPHSIAH